ncbi:MAG: ATP-binding cassette domain-containing protein [Candidatus Zixiibacteriota bacterium]|nr:MAG: ATP-binding cassette domain-containing protein [candidate division Zixibacteria bacterium]
MIDFENVSYSYPDGTKAIDDLSLHISKGERVSFIGGNGSGKTTLALLIDGIIKPDSGKIKIGGLDPSGDLEGRIIKQKVGLVFQNPDNQLVSTTVEREIAFSLENRDVIHPELGRRVDNMLRFFGLDEFRTRLISELSGGEKQRLALASVMVAEPDIIIFDEPESFLDESGKRLLNDAIDFLLKEKPDLTVLRITQYAEVAEAYDRMLAFKDGRLFADGNPASIFSDEVNMSSSKVVPPLKYRLKSTARGRYDSESASEPMSPDSEGWAGITADSVCFRYNGDFDGNLFTDFSLSIDNRKVRGLVGRSGSGKTTLIQLMARLLKPRRGAVTYHGFPSKKSPVAVSFQQPERQFFLETVNKEIRFGAENLGLAGVEAIAAKCYELVGLPKDRFAQRNPFTLSGGEKRRLAFGTILSLEPAFIMFDEPTCGLDSEGIALFKNLVIQLKQRGVGIVIVSHYGDIILDLADEVIVLDKGVIASVKSKRDFFRDVDFSSYLSMPELLAYQIDAYGEIRYFSEAELRRNI